MNSFSSENIRNIVLLGHSKAGKTTLTEAMLFNAGVTDRLGSVADGTTVSDYDPEEIKRKISISTAFAPFEWKGNKFNIIDTPGYFDFVGGVQEGLRAADAALIVLSGRSGVSVGTEKAWDAVKDRNMPVMFFVNKLDDERANYQETLEQMKEKFSKSVAPFVYPIKEGDKFRGFVDIIDHTARRYEGTERVDIPVPEGMEDVIAPLRDMIMEAVAETSEELMDKYFAGEEFTFDEIKQAIRKGVKEGTILPVYCGSAQDNVGVLSLMDSIGKYLDGADAVDVAAVDAKTGDVVELKPVADEAMSAIVFKTVADPYVGKMSVFRVVSGKIKSDSVVYNPNTQTEEKIGKIYMLRGKKQIEVPEVSAGDIASVTKLVNTNTGDTLCSVSKPVILEGIDFPEPVLSMAVTPLAKGDEEKISQGLTKLLDEDLTFKIKNNTETKQLIISGQGDQHIDVIISKLKAKFGVNVKLEEPVVAYRETIRGKAKVEGKHKKQSGGHGQYGHVWIEFEPGDTEELTFCEQVFGGAVPKNFFPAVEKGLRECMQNGVLAGYPMVNVKATLLDGSYHPVDSSEMAFKVAASLAYKAGIPQAKPVLLEPVGMLKTYVPDEITGDVIGDINKRRGQIMGMGASEIKGLSLIEAEVPVAEMFKYATDLRSMSRGKGKFTFEFLRYDEAPANVTEKVKAEAAAKREE